VVILISFEGSLSNGCPLRAVTVTLYVELPLTLLMVARIRTSPLGASTNLLLAISVHRDPVRPNPPLGRDHGEPLDEGEGVAKRYDVDMFGDGLV